jgi:6-phosphogluconolactonase
MRVQRLRDAEEVAQRVAAAVAAAARAAIEERGVFAIALAGGDTPRRSYEQLARDSALDWTAVEFFWSDERPVPPDHPESNYRMARLALLDRLAIDPRRVHRIEAERGDLSAVASKYERALARVAPELDLVLLGMGADGHTASLFPHTAALAESQRWVVVNEVPALATRRITFTFPLIARARAVCVAVTGEAKAAALAEVLEGPSDPDRLPSQRLRACADRVAWFVDAAAAGRLRDHRFES